jgi:hypothetical protein
MSGRATLDEAIDVLVLQAHGSESVLVLEEELFEDDAAIAEREDLGGELLSLGIAQLSVEDPPDASEDPIAEVQQLLVADIASPDSWSPRNQASTAWRP